MRTRRGGRGKGGGKGEDMRGGRKRESCQNLETARSHISHITRLVVQNGGNIAIGPLNMQEGGPGEGLRQRQRQAWNLDHAILFGWSWPCLIWVSHS